MPKLHSVWLASVTKASSVAFSWVGAAVCCYRSRTAAGNPHLDANAIDPSVIAITSAEVRCRHTPRGAGKGKGHDHRYIGSKDSRDAR
jgi:hypothetical protein